MEHVFGYTVALDMTARDRQLVRHSCGGLMYDLVRGKNSDGACPVRPAVVTDGEQVTGRIDGIGTLTVTARDLPL